MWVECICICVTTYPKSSSLLLRPVSLQENGADRVTAWQHGLVSDGQLEWDKHCVELVQYAQQHGDAHIGYRDGDDPDLVRWAKKQRHAHKEQTC